MIGLMASRFVEAYPSEGARVLENAAPEVIAHILAGLAPAVGASLLRAMSPHAAAAGLARVEPDTAAALTERLPMELASALLLRLDETARSALLNALPTGVSLSFRLVLRFPAGTVGSLIDARVATVRREIRVGEARAIVRRAPELLRKYLYVLDNARLTGVVDARQCLLQPADLRISSLLQPNPVALRARTSLREASLLACLGTIRRPARRGPPRGFSRSRSSDDPVRRTGRTGCPDQQRGLGATGLRPCAHVLADRCQPSR